jgi:hypothetical protein
MPHLRIIEQSLWDSVKERQKLLKDKYCKGIGKPSTLYTIYPFSGLISCDKCRGKYIIVSKGVNKKRGKWANYGCQNSVNDKGCQNKVRIKDYHLKELIQIIRNEFYNKENLINLAKKIDKRLSEYLSKDTLEARTKKLEKEIESHIKSISNYDIAISLAKDRDNVSNLTETLDEQYKLKRLKQGQLDSLIKEEGIIEFDWETEFKKVSMLDWTDKAELRRFFEKTIIKLTLFPLENGNLKVNGIFNLFGNKVDIDIPPIRTNLNKFTKRQNAILDRYENRIDKEFDESIDNFIVEYKTKYIKSNTHDNLMTY